MSHKKSGLPQVRIESSQLKSLQIGFCVLVYRTRVKTENLEQGQKINFKAKGRNQVGVVSRITSGGSAACYSEKIAA